MVEDIAKEKLVTFTDKDLRWDYYPMFLNLMKKGYEIEAYILILATWNSSRFRFVNNKFDLYAFQDQINKIRPFFDKMKHEDFQTIDFDKYSHEIKCVFKVLSEIKGIESTGASKLMHLKLPKIFVMWDRRIRKEYKYMTGDAGEYIKFLKDMQLTFSDNEIKSERTLAKLIDENNYIKITMPALEKEKRKKKKKK